MFPDILRDIGVVDRDIGRNLDETRGSSVGVPGRFHPRRLQAGTELTIPASTPR